MKDGPKTSFSQFIEYAGLTRRAIDALAGKQRSVAECAREQWSGRVLGPLVSRERVERALGEPNTIDDHRIGYFLDSFPNHVYSFVFDESGRQVFAGFVRRVQDAAVDPPPASDVEAWKAYVDHLAAMGATESDILPVLGAPESRIGWWPRETLYYSGGRALELCHSIVVTQ